MNLVDLEIERERFGKNKGQFRGKIKFDNEHGEVSLRLTQKHIDSIFEVCADAIVSTAKDAAREMTCAVIEHQKSIEQQ